jgi:hypothetical protein
VFATAIAAKPAFQMIGFSENDIPVRGKVEILRIELVGE